MVNENKDPNETVGEDFRRLIEESPLGHPGARALRDRVPPARAEALLQRVKARQQQRTAQPETSSDLGITQARVGWCWPAVFGHHDPSDWTAAFAQYLTAPTGIDLPMCSPRPQLDLHCVQETVTGIATGIAEIIEEVTGIKAREITMETSFVEDLDIDEMSLVEILVQIDETFALKIPDEDAAGLRTVGDVVHYIVKLAEENPEAAAPTPTEVKPADAPACADSWIRWELD